MAYWDNDAVAESGLWLGEREKQWWWVGLLALGCCWLWPGLQATLLVEGEGNCDVTSEGLGQFVPSFPRLP
ncbi:hypothetical protein Pyn_30397 [Prunus yedoensis var. nudiflora]|uniref:Uncharacterized protein n=1 Tax=Prunus yedoensis var. nudiflora TaxID=2094558 RepID=A0A314UDQ0_PRUYE|nr:hypothetical protein Pyn_30397 [Prunus yedoensis var. nudiflora]